MSDHGTATRGEGRCPRTEELGTYLSGGLDEHAALEYRRHMDTCPSCSAEGRSLRPVIDALAALPADLSLDEPEVPVQLGDRLLARAAAEQRRRRVLTAVGSLAAAITLVFGAITVGRQSVGAPKLTGERFALTADIPGSSAVVWVTERNSGTYLELTATGLPVGRYRMWFALADGSRVPVGSFRGVGGDQVLRCPGSSDKARGDIVAVGASDDQGNDVLTASMRQPGPIGSYTP